MAPLALVALAFVVGVGGTKILQSASWPIREPALGILAWLAVGTTAFLSLVLAGLALAIPKLPTSNGLTELFNACSVAVREHYATPGGGVAAVLGAGLAVVLLLRFSHTLLGDLLVDRRSRSRHADLLSVVASHHPEPDVMVLDHSTPAAYCLPGRRHQIVVTQGALGVLSETELRQVLAHERAHLRSHHHLAGLVAKALANALCGRLGTKELPQRVAELVEMHADDAGDQGHRSDLARAVVLLARGGMPIGAMGAGTAALSRVRRLSQPAEPVTSRERWGVIAAACVLLALPVAVAMTPAVMAIVVHYCPTIG